MEDCFKEDIAIRRVFFLVAHDYKDRIFKLSRLFCSLHGSVGKYINLSLGGTFQQYIALKFVKIGVFRTHPSFFYVFTHGTVSIKFQVNAMVLFKTNAKMSLVEGRNSKILSTCQCACSRNLHENVMNCACVRDLHENVMYVLRTLTFVCLVYF